MLTLWTTYPGWQAVGWTMIHFLWIGALMGLVTLVGRSVLSRCRPLVRYLFLIGCFALLALTPWPILRHLLGTQTWISPHDALLHKQAVHVHVSDASSTTESVVIQPGGSSVDEPVSSVAIPENHKEAAWHAPWKTRLDRFALVAPWIWLIGSPLLLLLVYSGLTGAQRLRRQSQPLPERWVQELANRLKSTLRIGRTVAIAINERVTSPVLIGVVKPLILLPPALIGACTTEQIEMILLHELAHIRRWDPWVNLFQEIVQCLLFFHPAVWIVSRWIRIERENCCDEIVLQQTGNPEAYAETLAYLAMPEDYPRIPVLAMARHPLVNRIRHILLWQDRRIRVSPILFVGLMLVCLSGLTLALGVNRHRMEPLLRTEPTAPKNVPLENRVLHFPDDRSVGLISIRKPIGYDINTTYTNWTFLAAAVGQVEIPAQHQVQLSLRKDAAHDLRFLNHLNPNDIQQLSIRSDQIRDGDLRHLSHLTGLNTLWLNGTKISDRGLVVLGRLERLCELGLDSTSISNEGVAHLSQLPSLRYIGLAYTQITDRGVATLSQQPGLEGLNLGHTQVSDEGLQHLSVVQGLRHLYLDGCSAVTDAGLSPLSSLTSLEKLSLTGSSITNAGLPTLAPLISLKKLNLRNTDVTDEGCVHLNQFPALETVKLPLHITMRGWTHLAGHPSLRSWESPNDALLAHGVSFQELRSWRMGGACTDAGMDLVAQIPSLQDIHLNHCQVTDDGLAKLVHLRDLRELHLNDTAVTHEGLKYLAAFSALEKLTLQRFRGDANGLEVLAHLDSLETLELNFKDSYALTDETLVPLSNLTGLVSLKLEGPLTDRALHHLKSLTRLRRLELKNSWLTDEGMAILGRLPELEMLMARGHFTDGAIPNLTQIRSLMILELHGHVQITETGQARLAALPTMQSLRLHGDPEPLKIREPAIVQAFDQKGQLARKKWYYTFQETKGSATLDMAGVTLVFEGVPRRGRSGSYLQVGGNQPGRKKMGTGVRDLSRHYRDGVTTLSFRKHHFKLLDGGNRLSIQGKDIDLTQGKKRITIRRDGSIKTEAI